MEINDLLVPEGVVADLKTTSKKQALQDLAKRAAEVSGLHVRAIFDVLMERERLGTTGVGNGIAIPHGKLPNLDRLHGLFARLENPIDFQAIDERPVDLIFVLLAPEAAGADHLKALGLEVGDHSDRLPVPEDRLVQLNPCHVSCRRRCDR